MSSFNIDYGDSQLELSKLSNKYGSDKGTANNDKVFRKSNQGVFYYHNYTSFYQLFFSPWKNSVKSVFECGIGTNNVMIRSNMGENGVPGASLRMWEEFFPNASIYGADIDKDILIAEGRITSFHVDQTSDESVKELSEQLPKDLDIIIDDGLHTGAAAITLFRGIYGNLRAGGTYIIEDAWKGSMSYGMRDEIIEWLTKEGIQHSVISFTAELHDTMLIMIQKPHS